MRSSITTWILMALPSLASLVSRQQAQLPACPGSLPLSVNMARAVQQISREWGKRRRSATFTTLADRLRGRLLSGCLGLAGIRVRGQLLPQGVASLNTHHPRPLVGFPSRQSAFSQPKADQPISAAGDPNCLFDRAPLSVRRHRYHAPTLPAAVCVSNRRQICNPAFLATPCPVAIGSTTGQSVSGEGGT